MWCSATSRRWVAARSRCGRDPEVDAGRLQPVGFGRQRLHGVIASGEAGRQQLH